MRLIACYFYLIFSAFLIFRDVILMTLWDFGV